MPKAVHVIVSGRVQGVGYRAWCEERARSAELSGWVRNRREGTVEAVLSGEPAAVETMLSDLRQGPRGAAVTEVRVLPHDSPVAPGFAVRPTL